MNKTLCFLNLLVLTTFISCSSDDGGSATLLELQVSKMTIEESIDLGQTYPQRMVSIFENGLPKTDSIYFENNLSFTSTYEYNNLNDLESLKFYDPNSVLMEEYLYTYDGLQRMQSISYQDFVFPFNSLSNYNYDQNNSIDVNNGSFTIAYDSNELVTAINSGSMALETATYNGLLPQTVNVEENDTTFDYTFIPVNYKGGFRPRALFSDNRLNGYLHSDGLSNEGALTGLGNSNQLVGIQRTFNNLNITQNLTRTYTLDSNDYLKQITEASTNWSLELKRISFEYE
ncbi:MAG: hypothetical protein ACJAT0_002558 [Nonlabens sp.]|jgi:hypothetical protein|uniref:hypothetical protein n=2 Tax=Nonlabens sp. TaxID=1888209 RepID=UPI0039E699B9